MNINEEVVMGRPAYDVKDTGNNRSHIIITIPMTSANIPLRYKAMGELVAKINQLLMPTTEKE
jgi:hypothetical protein